MLAIFQLDIRKGSKKDIVYSHSVLTSLNPIPGNFRLRPENRMWLVVLGIVTDIQATYI